MLRNWGGEGGRFLEDTKEGERPKETTEGRAKGAKKKMNKKRRKGLHCGGRPSPQKTCKNLAGDLA